MNLKRKIQNHAPLSRAARARLRARLGDIDGLDSTSTAKNPRADIACAISELIYLTRNFGVATIHEWCSHVRPEASRATAERQWERIKLRLVELGIPHERVPVERVTTAEGDGFGHVWSASRPQGVGIVMKIGCEQVDEYIPQTGHFMKIARTREVEHAARVRESLGGRAIA